LTKRPIKNVAASVHDRLLAKARESNRRFDELLRYFGMERFLYRLCMTPHADRFILKGALMFRVWQVDVPRPTLDIDLLGRPSVVTEVETVVREVCQLKITPNDGLLFDPESVKTAPRAERADFTGIRASFLGRLVNARIPMQIDIGFGTVYPAPVMVDLPTILDFPPPRLQGYTRESAVSEKLEAMVKLEILNSCMKDFFDIWLLSQRFAFDGYRLSRAISETFSRRRTSIPAEPVALTATFAEDSSKVAQWRAFSRKQQLGQFVPESLRKVIDGVAAFLKPVTRTLAVGDRFQGTWPPGGPWR